MIWKPVRDKEKYGVVVHNFQNNEDWNLQLSVGNTVHNLEENGEWFYGFAIPNREVCGIYPKTFIHIKDSIVDRTGRLEIVTPRMPLIVQELTGVLKEWGPLLQKLYCKNEAAFNDVNNIMVALISDRKQMLSGQLPADEMKHLKQQVTLNIDYVNSLLSLDLVVRNEQGNLLNPDITSTVKLYRHHQQASETLRKKNEKKRFSDNIGSQFHLHSSWTLKIIVDNIILKVPDPCQISMGLYMVEGYEGREGKELRSKPLVEPYVFHWTVGGYTDNSNLFSSLKCLFTDLSTRAISQKPLYLVATVVREGTMNKKEGDKRASSSAFKKVSASHSIRRPYGIFIIDISEELRKLKEEEPINDISNATSLEIYAPFYHCREKDTLDSVFWKAVNSSSEVIKEKPSDYNFWFNFSLYNGDLKRLQHHNPHHASSLQEMAVCYPLTLSDLISPDDVRNDLYVTLLGGEFSRERNVEVTVKVCNEDGQAIPGVLHIGCGKPPQDEYRTVTYHHEEKPRWMETFKVALPIEEFRKAHLRFIFKHRSTNEVKDKSEKPFALSFVNLMQSNGTTLLNVDHELIVYKIDPKKYNGEDATYLKFPCMRINGEELQKFREDGFSLSPKDKFFISTIFCSTKLTQNAELLSLLEWGASDSSSKSDLKHHLAQLKNVPSSELIIFLQDTLNVLFQILMNSSKELDTDKIVFEALVDIIHIAVEQNKHESRTSALDTYIKQNFHATLIFQKLIAVFQSLITEVCSPGCFSLTGSLNKAMKCFYYIMKFIIRSRKLYYRLDFQGTEDFENRIEGLLNSIVELMAQKQLELMPLQGLCLKYIATTIPDVMTEFSYMKLSRLLIEIVLHDHRLAPQRLIAMNEICHSSLFVDPACRSVLLKAFIQYVKKLFAENEEVTDSEVVLRKEKVKGKLMKILGTAPAHTALEDKKQEELKQLQLCVKGLCDVLDILFGSEVGSTVEDIMHLVRELLQDVISIISKMSDEDELLPQFVAVFISLLRQTPDQNFIDYLYQFEEIDLINFEVELLLVFRKLIEKPVFPLDWCEMIMLQNSIFMKVLRLLSKVLTEKMMDPFVDAVWVNYFNCSVLFITQRSLQLEMFVPIKRSKIYNRYKDLRREAAQTVTDLWRTLGSNQLRFIVRKASGNSLIGPFLEMTMLPVVDVRKCTIPIFYEMMLCEFNSTKERSKGNGATIKGKFNVFESEMLEQLDALVEGGRGDEHYRELFVTILRTKCREKSTFTKQVMEFVITVGKLMEKLLQYRNIRQSSEHSPDIRMSCTASLLDFYASINRKELYLRYVYKLVNLHYQSHNFTEAAYTLKNHACLLSWKHEIIPESLKSIEDSHIKFHDDLKEKLYHKIIENFCKGKMWEAAVKLSKELLQRHEEITMNYSKVSSLLSDMSKYYQNIMNPETSGPKPSYFRVAYYGRGYPAFLQNKVFVYRGHDYERLADFQFRILDQFPNAELMKNLSPPGDDLKESPQQYIQINNINCEPKENKFTSMYVDDCIRQYYEHNHIDTFSFYRPFHQGQKDPENEFATLFTEKTTLKTNFDLPGLLKCFPVLSEEKVIFSPLQNAVKGMREANQDLIKLIKKYVLDSSISLDNLTRKLSGMVDAAVMGGIKNYEKAFLTSDYETKHPEDFHDIELLKSLISDQIPLLELALDVHSSLVGEKLADLHSHMVESFRVMKTIIQKNYGVSEKPVELEQEVKNLRRLKRLSSHELSSARSSHYSLGGDLVINPPKTPISTMPRSKKLSSASLAGYKKEKKDKAFRNLLRRDSLCNTPKSATSWFMRPDSGIDMHMQESSNHSIQENKVSVNIAKSPLMENPVQHSPSSSSLDQAILSEITTENEESFPFHEVEENSHPLAAEGQMATLLNDPLMPSDDIPPPLPVKSKNLDPDRYINSFTNQNGCNDLNEGDDTAPEKPPRPATYQSLDFMNRDPSPHSS